MEKSVAHFWGLKFKLNPSYKLQVSNNEFQCEVKCFAYKI